MKTLYTAHAAATSGRDGHVTTADDLVSLDLSVPKPMGGPGKVGASNPEMLFAAGYSACFGGAMEFVAKQRTLDLGPITVQGAVSFGVEEAGHFRLGVTLTGAVPGQSAAFVQELMEAAHQVCPYSRATRNNIDVVLVGS